LGSSPLVKIKEVLPIKEQLQDDLFITCGSFEERFLGVPKKIKNYFPHEFILFRFSEPNDKRDELIEDMVEILDITKYDKNYSEIKVDHGKSLESIIAFHNHIQNIRLISKDLVVTLDITTFTKDLLLNLMFCLTTFLRIKKLRLLYTIPNRYASPEEDWLSFGIQNVHLPPMSWNEWSPLKNDLLIIILGFEEMRAWSLIDRFSANQNWLILTKPGSKPEWNLYCEEYNRRLLKEIKAKDSIPALDPAGVTKVFSKHITKEISDKYNVFVSPTGPKPQLIGVLDFVFSHSHIPINLITTDVVRHNVPYYSWGIGDTFEFFFYPRRDN